MHEPIPEPTGPNIKAKSPSKLPIVIGFLVGTISWLSTLIPQQNYGALVPLVFSCFALPVIAAILAIIPRTRRFGLGLLLACGLGWLILGAICGSASLAR